MATRKISKPASKPVSSPATQPPAAAAAPSTASYQHPDAIALIRPEAGAQTRFKKKKPAATWRYDSSLAPELQWDDHNPAREQGEAHLAAVQAALAQLQSTLAAVHEQLVTAKASQPAAELHQLLQQAQASLKQLQAEPLRTGRDAAGALKALSRPFLNWAGKAEHLRPGITRVYGPFVFEATIPTVGNFDGDVPAADPQQHSTQDSTQNFITRMVEVLRSSPVLHLAGGNTVQLSGIRWPEKRCTCRPRRWWWTAPAPSAWTTRWPMPTKPMAAWP